MEGSQMKMREAVEAALSELDKFGQCHDARLHFADIFHIGRARGMLIDALSAPARQCDVGTPEEQFKRYHKFCMGGHGCSKCKVGIRSGAGCSLAWAQTPYDAERKGEGDGR